jgi:hypothetical protein
LRSEPATVGKKLDLIALLLTSDPRKLTVCVTLVSLEVLHGPLMLLSRCPGIEGAKIFALAGFWVFLF